jgi:hypothetical protein
LGPCGKFLGLPVHHASQVFLVPNSRAGRKFRSRQAVCSREIKVAPPAGSGKLSGHQSISHQGDDE